MAVVVASGRRAICTESCRAASLRGCDSLPGTVACERHWVERYAKEVAGAGSLCVGEE